MVAFVDLVKSDDGDVQLLLEVVRDSFRDDFYMFQLTPPPIASLDKNRVRGVASSIITGIER